jgi:membrane protein insertase Oxa1/YidC/SpoIIIJ
MKVFFDYCYYRIAKAYRVLDNKDYCMWGSFVLFSTFGFVLLSIFIFLFYMFDKKIDTAIIWTIVMIVSVLSLFFVNKKKFTELYEKYKDEKNSKLKGWLVFLYIIGSVVSFFVSLALCGYWVSV